MAAAEVQRPKVSVIIPVKDPGDGAERLLESLLNQSLGEIEMIFVDDCGTDGTMELVRNAAAEDPRIVIISNDKNIGPGPSRNKGIEAARGEYLQFSDPDDYLSPDFLKLLYEAAESSGCDIAKGTFVTVDQDTGQVIEEDIKQNDRISSLKDELPLFRLFKYEHQSAIFARNLFDDPDVRYGSSRVGEDVYFLLTASLKARKLCFAEDAFYYYVRRGGSLTNTYDRARVSETFLNLREKTELLSKKGLGEGACIYMSNYIDNAMAAFNAAAFNDSEMFAEEDKWAGELKQIIRGIPGFAEMYAGFPEISALLKYSFMSPPLSSWIVISPGAAARRWTDFWLAGRPGNDLRFAAKYSRAIHAFSITERITDKSKWMGPKDTTVKEQIKRLPAAKKLMFAGAFCYTSAKARLSGG